MTAAVDAHVALIVPRDSDAMVVACGCSCGWVEPIQRWRPIDPAVAVLAWAEHRRHADL